MDKPSLEDNLISDGEFEALVDGKIDIIDYLNAECPSVGDNETTCLLGSESNSFAVELESAMLGTQLGRSGGGAPDDAVARIYAAASAAQSRLISGNGQDGHGSAGGHLVNPGGAPMQQNLQGPLRQQHHQNQHLTPSTNSGYEHRGVAPVHLPESPPATDSAPGSTGSPSSSDTAPYSPDYGHGSGPGSGQVPNVYLQPQQHNMLHLQQQHQAMKAGSHNPGNGSTSNNNAGGVVQPPVAHLHYQQLPPAQNNVEDGGGNKSSGGGRRSNGQVNPGQISSRRNSSVSSAGVILSVPDLNSSNAVGLGGAGSHQLNSMNNHPTVFDYISSPGHPHQFQQAQQMSEAEAFHQQQQQQLRFHQQMLVDPSLAANGMAVNGGLPSPPQDAVLNNGGQHLGGGAGGNGKLGAGGANHGQQLSADSGFMVLQPPPAHLGGHPLSAQQQLQMLNAANYARNQQQQQNDQANSGPQSTAAGGGSYFAPYIQSPNQDSSPREASLNGFTGSPYAPLANQSNHTGLTGSMPRKRMRQDSMSGSPSVKPEPISPPSQGQMSGNHHGGSDDSITTSEDQQTGPAGSTQQIRFSEFTRDRWHNICDANGRELVSLGVRIVADKGFNHSPVDQAFINQKKNHFQITVEIEMHDHSEPSFVNVPGEGLKPLTDFHLEFYGAKAEMLTSRIQIRQSQNDRRPVAYEGARFRLPPNKVTKVTVHRLHFSETTMNNQRKNGRPNPDQKYLQLIIALNAVVQETEKYLVVAYTSERVIVRASNPGQFENNENDVPWQRGTGPSGSIYCQGPVGIGTNNPQSALHVHGDIHVVGKVTNPSDRTLKQNIETVDYAEALERMQQIRIVNYELKPEIAEQFGLTPEDTKRIGVIAQEIEAILPDAVRNNGPYLQVDENRIFFESAAAVKELCRLTGNLEFKIDEVEKMANKFKRLAKLRKLDSFRSTTTINSESNVSRLSSIPPPYSEKSSATSSPVLVRKAISPKDEKSRADLKSCIKAGKHHCERHEGNSGAKCTCAPHGKCGNCGHDRCKSYRHNCHHDCERTLDRGLCNNKILQATVVVLVVVMAFCLIAMATLYILDWRRRREHSYIYPPNWAADNNTSYSGNGPDPGKIIVPVSVIPPVPTSLPLYPPSHGPPLHPCLSGSCPVYCCTPAMEASSVALGFEDREKKKYLLADEEIQDRRNESDVGKIQYDSITDRPQQRMKRRMNEEVDDDDSSRNTPHLMREGARIPSKHPAQEFPSARITIPTLNFTMNNDYCYGDSCSYPEDGRFVYYIPISKYMPTISLRVEFGLDEDGSVDMCDFKMITCEGHLAGKAESIPVPDSTNERGTRHVTAWRLPVGLQTRGLFSFRVAYSSACMLDADERGATFTQYDLVFYRLC